MADSFEDVPLQLLVLHNVLAFLFSVALALVLPTSPRDSVLLTMSVNFNFNLTF